MFRYLISVVYMMVTLLSLTVIAAGNATPEGLWLARDEDGEATGYIMITEDHGVFTGVIKRGAHPETQERICSKCTGERKDKALVGMVMMKNVKAQDGVFLGDEILDPLSGNTYRVKLKMLEHNKMEVRGYIGISLLGRTQIWERVENGQ